MSTIRHAATPALRGNTYGQQQPIITTERPTGGSTVTTTPTVGDAVLSRVTTTNSNNNFDLSVPTASAIEFTSNTPSICSVSASGSVSTLANGACEIDVCAYPARQKVARTMVTSTSVDVNTFTSWVAGSLAKHVDDAIRAMVVGKSPGSTTQNVLTSSSGGHTAPNHARNANLFTGALDLSAISVYTSSQGNNRFPVVLLSQRHLIAGHVGATPGQSVVFKRLDGGYEVRTVVSQLRLVGSYSDNYVALLDSPITTINPMPLLPGTFASKLPSHVQTAFYPNMHVLNKGWTAGDKIRVLQFFRIESLYENYMTVFESADATLAPWSGAIIGGDSNGPVFMPVNGVAVLLHCMNFTSGGGFYPSQLADIQAKMNSLVGGYSVTQVDVSGFNSY